MIAQTSMALWLLCFGRILQILSDRINPEVWRANLIVSWFTVLVGAGILWAGDFWGFK